MFQSRDSSRRFNSRPGTRKRRTAKISAQAAGKGAGALVQAVGRLLFFSVGVAATPAEIPVDQPTSNAEDESVAREDGDVTEAALSQQQPPLDLQRELQPMARDSAPSELSARLFGPSGAGRSLLTQQRRDRATAPASDVVLGVEAKTRVTSDTGSLLGKSPSSLGLGIQRRTPIVTDPKSRGNNTGQQLASGSYWFPARQDLDTLLSKIDSRLVQDIIVIKGPYSAMYGPAFSFYDVQLLGTPRYEGGPEWHGATSVDYQTNGEQWNGRQSIWGGSTDWGFRASYGHRTGNDYESGDGSDIPASYNSRDLDIAFGLDLTEDSHIEFSYLRLDQTDVEFAAQPFDMDFLVTDAFDVKYTLENQCYFDRLFFETWYNRTRFDGNAQRRAKRRQIPELNCDPAALITLGFPGICVNNPPTPGSGGVLDYRGFTNADAASTGFLLAASWGDADCGQLIAGVDLRYLKQELNELDFSPEMGTSRADHNFNFPIPDSHSSNPGLLLEHILPVSDALRIRSGARVDWVSMNAASHMSNTDLDKNGVTDDLEESLGGGFNQHFVLWSGFVTGECDLCCNWTATAGFGYAMRPPTLTEMYAAQTFLAILQQGFSFVLGNPNLDAERLYQIDLGVRADYDDFRAGSHAFYKWVHDYITYESFATVPGLPDALGVQFTNTDRATLAGFESYCEYDCNRCTTAFATMSYVEGRDHTRDRPSFASDSAEEPLPGIPPLESRVGLRLHEPCPNPRWGVEIAARIVDHQDRVASSLFEQETPGFTTYDIRSFYQACDNVLLVAGVENFTDKQYREHLDLRTGTGVFQPGASFYFGVEVTY